MISWTRLTELQVSDPNLLLDHRSCVLLCRDLPLLVKTVSVQMSQTLATANRTNPSVLLFGTEVSRLRPKYYAYIFIGCDVVSLALQG